MARKTADLDDDLDLNGPTEDDLDGLADLDDWGDEDEDSVDTFDEEDEDDSYIRSVLGSRDLNSWRSGDWD